ncbi:glycoside hydrolase family protein [Aeromonas veronii]|uniref:glycoside hydrolase family protein n=1 Tax=Aeromonas veronii TaxID=654 RepID=UPI003D1BE967
MATDALVNRIKQNEGSISYQKKTGTYKDGKFKLYKDSLGFWTIGYGHLCSDSEVKKYKDGLSETLAGVVLLQDVMEAEQGARRLFEMNRHSLEVQDVLIEMVFQLGERKAAGFKKFKAALDAQDYHNAAHELKDSSWYKQTTNRVKAHIDVLLAASK